MSKPHLSDEKSLTNVIFGLIELHYCRLAEVDQLGHNFAWRRKFLLGVSFFQTHKSYQVLLQNSNTLAQHRHIVNTIMFPSFLYPVDDLQVNCLFRIILNLLPCEAMSGVLMYRSRHLTSPAEATQSLLVLSSTVRATCSCRYFLLMSHQNTQGVWCNGPFPPWTAEASLRK